MILEVLHSLGLWRVSWQNKMQIFPLGKKKINSWINNKYSIVTNLNYLKLHNQEKEENIQAPCSEAQQCLIRWLGQTSPMLCCQLGGITVSLSKLSQLVHKGCSLCKLPASFSMRKANVTFPGQSKCKWAWFITLGRYQRSFSKVVFNCFLVSVLGVCDEADAKKKKEENYGANQTFKKLEFPVGKSAKS